MYSYNFEAFTSPCELHIAAKRALADDVARIIYLNAKRLENQFSFFISSSELYPINNRTKNTLPISDELYNFIELSLFYYEKTEGAFDVALAGTLKESSLASTMQNYHQKKRMLLPFASSSQIKLNNNEITFSNDYTKIDLGGIVKEYAVDNSILLLKQAGIESALVNFGGDVAAIGTYNSNFWNIGIQNPLKLEENLCTVQLKDNALCTSGHSKRFHEIEKEKKSHIISQNSKHYAQISITAPTATDAGIWSTALMVNPKLTPPTHIKIANSII